jgi:hypothetical protein
MAQFSVGNRVRVLSTPATTSYVSRSGTVARVARNFAGAWGVSYVVILDDHATNPDPLTHTVFGQHELEAE